MIQLTILKITGYGPWTLTLGSDREHELQMLQSKLYNNQILLERGKTGWEQGESNAESKRGKDVSV